MSLSAVPFDYVVTVCDHANETCPVFPGKEGVHVGFDDPPRLARRRRRKRRRWAITAGCATRSGFRRARCRDGLSAAGEAKYVAEIFGTFALVFAGTGAIVIDDVSPGRVTHVGVALTFGLVVMAMIYAVGDVSGAHLNPAVTLGFWLAPPAPAGTVLPYIVSQLGRRAARQRVAAADVPRPRDARGHAAARAGGAVVRARSVLTALLMFVILCVSTGPKEQGVMAGIAVGGVIALEAMFAGPICGASMNPARSLAPAVVSGTRGTCGST